MDTRRHKLQLLGATCLHFASKYEEVCLPHIIDFVYLASSSGDANGIMAMERIVFQAVNFNMGFAYPISFLRLYIHDFSSLSMASVHNLSKCYLDLFMSIYELAHKLPSVIAEVSLYLSYFVSGKKLPAEVYSLIATSE
uniref:Uncharacterized protein n=1 Tax=Panagrolaimus sp. ES5 TaxID=591445 RepID=A0AC34G560_9BILA